jgi:hypothetical protein
MLYERGVGWIILMAAFFEAGLLGVTCLAFPALPLQTETPCEGASVPPLCAHSLQYPAGDPHQTFIIPSP